MSNPHGGPPTWAHVPAGGLLPGGERGSDSRPLSPSVSSSCVHGMRCADGSCVWRSQWCDGVTDCPAGRDEADCGKKRSSRGQTSVHRLYTHEKEHLNVVLAFAVKDLCMLTSYQHTAVHSAPRSKESRAVNALWSVTLPDCGHLLPNCLCSVRLHGSGFLLQIYSTQTGTWRTVCSHGWTERQGRASCRQVGYSR